jgi:phage terminase large subunit-like protein
MISQALSKFDTDGANHDWILWARKRQLPPENMNFRTWLILGGRGAGKTRAGAEWIRALALGTFEPTFKRCTRIAIVAPNFHEARTVMIEGVSGLLAVHHDDERPVYEPSRRLITWGNGTIAQVFSAEEPDSLRGPQFDAAWCDEMAKWKKGSDVWTNLQMALRLGEVPLAAVSTTPRPTKLIRELMKDADTVVTRMPTSENGAFLSASFLKDMTKRYAGTRLGRQELEGELINDDPDALFRRDLIEKFRLRQAPELTRVVVAVDPPATSGKHANACGIVCAGLGKDGRCYVLDDVSAKRLKPAQWALRVLSLYETRNADRIVVEVNQGGEMVEAVLRQVDPNASLRKVTATKAKTARAEPVAALYEQGRVSHVGAFPELEDEMCTAIDDGKSPDRLDALVWAVTDLMLRKKIEPRVRSL